MTINRELPNEEIVGQVVAEIVELEHDVVAIACVMVRRNGSVTKRLGFTEGHKFGILAGLELTAFDLKAEIANKFTS